MFVEQKTIVCLQFSKYKVLGSLAHISGSKVNIIDIDEITLGQGVVEEGIVYDSEYLERVIKNLVTSVTKKVKKVDSAWISIPDYKVRILNIHVPKLGGDRLDYYQMHKVVEEKLQYKPSKLYLYSKPIHDINNYMFMITYAIKQEHVAPYQESFSSINIPLESIFPTFDCIYMELKSYFVVPTLLLYPYYGGYKFLVADEYGVHLDSIWGHNIIEINEDLDKAIQEIVLFTQQSKDIALNIKKILVVESKEQNSDLVQICLAKTRLEYGWIPSNLYESSALKPMELITLKGLLKNGAKSTNPKGFLSPNPIQNDDLDAKYITNTVTKSSNRDFSQNKHFNPQEKAITEQGRHKVSYSNPGVFSRNKLAPTIVPIVLTLLLMSSIGYAGWRIANKVLQSENVATNDEIKTTDIISNVGISTVTDTPTPTLAPTTEVTPTETFFNKAEVKVLVLNGNNVVGEARLITSILQTNGFITKNPGNYPQNNVPTTSVKYKDKKSKVVAEEIVRLIEKRYPSTRAEYDPDIQEDILVILGVS